MISKINNREVLQFIQAHLNHDPAEIALQSKKYPDLPIREIASQIASRQKAKEKLPEWWANPEVIFPPKENLEQASSEITAKFKSRWVGGSSILDLTGGSGIDLFYMAESFEKAVYVEPNKELAELTEYNFRLFQKEIGVYNGTAEAYLKNNTRNFDVIYLDPSRRDENNKKVFGLDQYQPNVFELYVDLLKFGGKVVIKTSPMIDLKQCLEQLSEIVKIQVVAVGNEVKEVLLYLEPGKTSKAQIEAWNISDSKPEEKFKFTLEEEQECSSEYSKPLKYIYEPNSAIRKAGAFNVVGKRFGLLKLHPNTHLYTANEVKLDFPGKIFMVKEFIKANKKEIRKSYPNGKVNVIAKNYPIGATEIKKKFRVKDGGEHFLIFCTIMNEEKVVIEATKTSLE